MNDPYDTRCEDCGMEGESSLLCVYGELLCYDCIVYREAGGNDWRTNT